MSDWYSDAADDHPEMEGYTTRWPWHQKETSDYERELREAREPAPAPPQVLGLCTYDHIYIDDVRRGWIHDEGYEEFVERTREQLSGRYSHDQLFWELRRRVYFAPDEGLVSYEEFQNRLKSRPGGAPFSADGRPLFEFDEGYLLDGVTIGEFEPWYSRNWCKYNGWLPYQNDG